MKKSRLKGIFAILVIIICMVYFFWDIGDLFNTEDRHKVSVVYSSEALIVTHKLFFIIPTGKDHYFMAYDEDESGNLTGYVIKASEEWYEENFNPGSGFAKDLKGVEIDSLSKSYPVRYYMEVQEFAMDFQNKLIDSGSDVIVNYPYGLDHCFVIEYKTMAIQKLVMLVLNIGLLIFGMIIIKKKAMISPVLLRIFGVIVIADVIYFMVLLFQSF